MNIEELIPQRAPIIMVDEFMGVEDNVSRSGLTVREDNFFLDGDVLTECGLIEHIAQSAAARVGYVCRQMNVPVPIGFIGSVDRFSVDRLPRLGDKILTTITVLQEVMQITLIQATCAIDGQEVAGCRMKIFLDTDDKEKER